MSSVFFIVFVVLFTFCLVERVFAHQLKSPPYAVDQLVLFQKSEDFQSGYFQNTEIASNPIGGVSILRDSQPKFLHRGEYLSAVHKARFPFNELIPCWNVHVPKGTGLEVRVRVSETGEDWGTWYFLGRQGETPEIEFNRKDNQGRVDQDHILLQAPKRFFQFKVLLYSADGQESPVLKLFSVSLSNSLQDEELWKEFKPTPVALRKEDWERVLPVPFRSQCHEDEKIRWSICGPTSLSMVLEYYGIKRETKEVYQASLDQDLSAYGIWPMNIQAAFSYGLVGWVQRFRTWDSLKEQIALGRPVIASIKFAKGDVSNAPVAWTIGHLIVIRGFNENGDLLVNDPAGETPETGILTYKQDELERAWLKEGGIGYVLYKA